MRFNLSKTDIDNHHLVASLGFLNFHITINTPLLLQHHMEKTEICLQITTVA
jgi:hypothetical protein